MIVLYILLGVFIVMGCIALARKESSAINDDNPYHHPERKSALPKDMREYIKDVKKPERRRGIYEKVFKRAVDVIMSFCGLVILSPIYAILCLAVIIDDPGPVFFKQKRVGKNRTFFYLHKFRSMKMSTPHDMPTHMLENPDQYITRVGKFLRKSSLDEIPQIWDIFRGKMSIIGERDIIVTTKKNIVFSRVVAANSVSL